MTARTIPFWQQVLNDEREKIENSRSLHDVTWHKNRTLGFINGVWAAGAIKDSEQIALRQDIIMIAINRRIALKHEGVMI